MTAISKFEAVESPLFFQRLTHYREIRGLGAYWFGAILPQVLFLCRFGVFAESFVDAPRPQWEPSHPGFDWD